MSPCKIQQLRNIKTRKEFLHCLTNTGLFRKQAKLGCCLHDTRSSFIPVWFHLGSILRGYSHSTGMTFIPERVHSIPIDVTVSVYIIPGRNFILCKSFRNDFIPVFNPNKILVLEWHFILASCKLKTNSTPRWNHKLWGTQFNFRAKKRDGLFCLAQRSSLMVTLLVKTADMAISRHNSIFRETCAIFVFDVARVRLT